MKEFTFKIGDIISNEYGTFIFEIVGYEDNTSYKLYSSSTEINKLPKEFVESNFEKDSLATMRNKKII